MKTFFAIVLLATVVFLWQRNHQPPASTGPTSADKAIAGASISPTLHQPSQNWIKRPIDRAREVADQVRKQSEQNQQP